MVCDVNGTLRAIEVLVEAIDKSDAAGRAQIYAAISGFCNELKGNLDLRHIHHSYTLENLVRLKEAAGWLCGIHTVNSFPDIPFQSIEEQRSIRNAIRMLDDPQRWPSTCRTRNAQGEVVDGTSDPDA